MYDEDDMYDVVTGEDKCPICDAVLLEKIPKDKKLIRKSVRFFCRCGYYKDIPVKELEESGRDVID